MHLAVIQNSDKPLIEYWQFYVLFSEVWMSIDHLDWFETMHLTLIADLKVLSCMFLSLFLSRCSYINGCFQKRPRMRAERYINGLFGAFKTIVSESSLSDWEPRKILWLLSVFRRLGQQEHQSSVTLWNRTKLILGKEKSYNANIGYRQMVLLSKACIYICSESSTRMFIEHWNISRLL